VYAYISLRSNRFFGLIYGYFKALIGEIFGIQREARRDAGSNGAMGLAKPSV
jgi:hypothetical protein